MNVEFRRRNPASRRDKLDLLLASLRMDLPIAIHGLIVNHIAASVLVPRVLRYIIYRAVGLKLETPNIFFGAQFADTNVRIGKNTFVNANVHFEDVAAIVIGADCQIGMEALFVTSHHEMSGGKISNVPDPRPIHIGDRCWIGARAMVLPGVTIGDDCVIAAGSIVTRSCAPYGFYAGVPARRLKELDPNHVP